MTRKLASIQEVLEVKDHPNADKLEIAKVMGWNVVIKLGEFKKGDKCVFFEVDSVLPKESWSEFLESRKYRVKTCQLRGQLSQGLALPLSILPDGEYKEDDDVTKILGVKKYEPPQPQEMSARGKFPSFIPKTDEVRIQSAMSLLQWMVSEPYYITVKLDGSSMTMANHPNSGFVIASRNLELKPEYNNRFCDLARRDKYAERIPSGFAIQGELVGPKICKNRLGLDKHEFYVFNVFDIQNGQYLDFVDSIKFCEDNQFSFVPIEETGDFFDYNLEQLLEMACGFYEGTRNRREGLVVRPQVTRHTAKGKKISFKVLNNDYLLKDED